ncbi:hypothetical protein TNCV_4883761 [Trichonephila clavipes]|nr:hypothetical protein TNCV_4883761 [Trichonephila clavipes]
MKAIRIQRTVPPWYKINRRPVPDSASRFGESCCYIDSNVLLNTELQYETDNALKSGNRSITWQLSSPHIADAVPSGSQIMGCVQQPSPQVTHVVRRAAERPVGAVAVREYGQPSLGPMVICDFDLHPRHQDLFEAKNHHILPILIHWNHDQPANIENSAIDSRQITCHDTGQSVKPIWDWNRRCYLASYSYSLPYICIYDPISRGFSSPLAVSQAYRTSIVDHCSMIIETLTHA